jgi:hypothetical protein
MIQTVKEKSMIRILQNLCHWIPILQSHYSKRKYRKRGYILQCVEFVVALQLKEKDFVKC